MKIGGLLEVFENYARNSYIANIKLSIPEIRDFLESFLTRRTFFINGIMYSGANKKIDGEPVFIFSEMNFTTDDYIEAILPQLIESYTKAYGPPSDMPFTREWSPKPFKVEDERDKQQMAIIKERILEYNQKTLPFRLAKTMHHPIATVWFSSSSGRIDIDGKKGEVIISSQEEIEEFVDSTSYYSLKGGMHQGLRDLWFEVLNEDGSNPKFGWIDIDNPAELEESKLKEVVSKISKMLDEVGRKHLIVFSGRNYQIWYAPIKGERFNYASDIKNIAETYGYQAGAIVGNSVKYRNRAIAEQKILVDTSVYKSTQRLGFFFGMHFKPGRLEESTGLVRIPVKRSELSKFEPLVDAHPENVLLKFDELKARVDMFCQEVGLGEGFPYVDAGYPCYRTASGHNDSDHELVKRLEEWKKFPKMTEISKKNVGEEVLQSESITMMPKLDGWVGVMAFNMMGKFKVNGQSLDKTQKFEGMIDSIQSEKQRAVISTKGGLFGWDNYLTHSFEDICRQVGVTEAIVTGEIVTYNDKGLVARREAVTSIVSKQEAEPQGKISTHDNKAFRRLKFVIHDVLSFDGNDIDRDIPIAQRLALFASAKNDRISVMPHEVVSDNITENFEAYWKRNVEELQNEGLVIHANGRRYKIKRKYTLDAVIIGIDTSAKYWQDRKEILPTVIIAVSKRTSKGPTYVAFQRIGNFRISEDKRRDLFHQILGERRDDGWERKSFANVVPSIVNETAPEIYWVDPKVVVEVEYESLGMNTRGAFGFSLEQSTRAGQSPSARQRGYRLKPQGAFTSRRLIGPPVIIAIRPDKTGDSPRDISHTQAEGAGGLEISTKKVRTIAADELENPAIMKVTRVRTNPMYGYARGPRYIAAGGPASPTGTEFPAGSISFGDVSATLEKEYIDPVERGAPRRGKSGWKPHYRPIWDNARQHFGTGIDYYPEMTGLSFASADAIFDERGPNIPGSRDGIDMQQTKQFPLKKLLSREYHRTDEQNIEDAKQFGRAFAKEVANTPTQDDSQDILFGLVEKKVTEEDKRNFIKSKMKNRNFTSSKGFSALDRKTIRSNPASNNSLWNERTREYRKRFKEWDKEPYPKAEWLTVALNNYDSWEIPLLDKGMKFMDAEENFLYTPAEETIINSVFARAEADEDSHIFSVIEDDLGDEYYESEGEDSNVA